MGQRWGERRQRDRVPGRDKGRWGQGWSHPWNRSFEKTLELGETVPCSIVTGINRARGKAPRIGVGISSQQRQQMKSTYRAQKRFSLDPFRQKLWSKPFMELLQVFSKLHWLPQVKCRSLHWSNFSWWEEAEKRVINAWIKSLYPKDPTGSTLPALISICKGGGSQILRRINY